MDHFDEMSRPVRTDVTPAFIRRRSQSLKNGTHPFRHFGPASDHQAVSLVRRPQMPPLVPQSKVDAFGLQLGGVTGGPCNSSCRRR
jgi:hypothetical protein